MPIEDVDFLKKNSIKETFVFLVDSKERNRLTYPNPSDYVVEFQAPFKNVIALNLIDSSIPRTMYNIDVYNNSISFIIHSPSLTISANGFNKVFLTPGDYSIQTLIIELNNKLKMHLDNDELKPLVGITANTTTNPPDIQNRLHFTCPHSFIFDMKDSSIAETIGFDGYVRSSELLKPIHERYYDTININTENYQLYKSVNVPLDDAILADNTYTLFEGPRGVIRTIHLNNKVAQRFYVSFETNLVKLYVAFQSIASDIISFNIHEDDEGKPKESSVYSATIAVSFIDGAYSDSIDLRYKFTAQKYYWVVFDTDETASIYYNDVLVADMSFKVYENGIWRSYDNTEQSIYYQLSLRIDVCNEYNSLKPYGIYSLVGERYIILRCKEIEENSFRSLSYTNNSLGIAKFTLGVVGYKEERLDYSNVQNREFHPIGKLTRLTLRFETPTGKLYDFKDVNHTLVFSIKYLEPVSTTEFKKSIINSNYDGNFLAYQYGQEEQEEDSDDQDIDYNRDEFQNYKKNEANNLPWKVAQRNISDFYNEEEEESE